MPGGLKIIKRRLQSVRNTKKITSAMKLVSAAKLRKAQESVVSSRDYANAVSSLLSELLLLQRFSTIEHPLMDQREEIKSIRIIVIGGSRGLCGAYNTNVNKAFDSFCKEKKGTKIESVILGRKPAEYLRRINQSYNKSYETLSEDASVWPIDEVCSETENAFMRGEIDEVYVLYTKFRSALSVKVTLEKILPFESPLATNQASNDTEPTGGTIFEPSIAEVFEAVIPRIFRTKVLQAALESKASEHGSRMTAMDSASKNAGELGQKLQIKFNRLRQTGITAELLDIVGGAEALK